MKKQTSDEENDLFATRIQAKSSSWFERVFQSCTSDNTSSSRLTTSTRRGTTLQIKAHSNLNIHPTPRDSMTKPLASEYIDTILRHDSYAHDIEINRLGTGHSSLNDEVQVLLPLQTPVPAR